MSRKNVEVVRRGFQAFNRDGPEAVLTVLWHLLWQLSGCLGRSFRPTLHAEFAIGGKRAFDQVGSTVAVARLVTVPKHLGIVVLSVREPRASAYPVVYRDSILEV